MRIITLIRQFFLLSLLLSEIYFCSIIPANIDKNIPGWETYVATINIGTPNLSYKLQVSFDYDKIIIWEKLPSSSYSKKLGGSDYIYVGGKYLRVNIIEDRHKTITINNTYCWNCKGILGLAPSSIFWKIWPDISFSRSRITLGKVGSEIGLGEEKSLNLVNCMDYENFCKTRASSIRYKNTIIEDIILIFDPSTQNLNVPDYIYDEYTSDINIYGSDSDTENSDIVIEINLSDLEEESEEENEIETLSSFKRIKNHWKNDLKLNNEKIGTDIEINIKYSKLVCTNKDRGKNFYLKRNAPGENYIKLGTLALKSQIFHKYEDYMLIQIFQTNDFISIQNLILFGVQVILSIRWKITHLEILTPAHEVSKNSWIDIFCEILGVAVTITSFVLPSTLDLLSTHLDYYISTAVVISISLSMKIILWIDEIRIRINMINNNNIIINTEKTKTKFLTFERYIFRSFSQEVILLTGMWILALESRVEDLDSFIILITNIFLLYTTSYYALIILHYIISYLFGDGNGDDNFSKFPKKGSIFYYSQSSYTSSRSDVWKFRGFALLSFLIFGYQSIITVDFFLRPLFVKSFEEFQNVIVPGLIFLYFFVFIVASLMVGLFLEREKAIMLKKEKNETTKDSKNSTIVKLKNKKN